MGIRQSREPGYQKMGKSQSKDREMEPLVEIPPPAYEETLPSNAKLQMELLIQMANKAGEPGMCATNYGGQLIVEMLKQVLKADCQICKENLTSLGWKHLGNLIVFLMKRQSSSHLVNKLSKWLDIEADEMVLAIHHSQVPQEEVPQKKRPRPQRKPAVSSLEFWLGKDKT